MAITVGTLVQDAMFAAGVLGQDGTTQPNGDADIALCIRFLSRMLDSWSTENLLVYSVATETFTMVAAQAAYSTALLTNGRPVSITGMYINYGGVDYPIQMIDNTAYNQIGIKTIAAIPQYCYYDAGMPNGTMTFWPTPVSAMTCYVDCNRLLNTATLTTATTLTYPPGYDRALVDNLAQEILRPFGITNPATIATVKDNAMKSMRAIKIRNNSPAEMSVNLGSLDPSDLAYICYPW